jgi:hypothetical protein
VVQQQRVKCVVQLIKMMYRQTDSRGQDTAGFRVGNTRHNGVPIPVCRQMKTVDLMIIADLEKKTCLAARSRISCIKRVHGGRSVTDCQLERMQDAAIGMPFACLSA